MSHSRLLGRADYHLPYQGYAVHRGQNVPKNDLSSRVGLWPWIGGPNTLRDYVRLSGHLRTGGNLVYDVACYSEDRSLHL